MIEMIEANWLLILLAFLIGVAIAWYVFNVRRRTRVQADRRDVLDDGAERARRNQALVDAPATPATSSVPPAPQAATVSRDEDFSPRATASLVTPGAVIGAETVANLAAHQPEAIGRAEQAEADHFSVAAGAAGHDGDDLLRIKGIGPKLAARLNELGITRFAQIAAWDDAQIDRVDGQLGRFQGRIRRDDWVTQASLLEAGDTAAYEERFGRL